jgi:hypothetical protein
MTMIQFFSQSSSNAPRKKLQPNWRFLGVQHKSECSPRQIQTWLAETASLEMAKAGPIEDIPPGKNEIGGFRRAHVSNTILIPALHKSVLTLLCFYAQDYKSRKPVTINGFISKQYNCLYRRKCDCYVAIAVRTFQDKVQLFVSGEYSRRVMRKGEVS